MGSVVQVKVVQGINVQLSTLVHLTQDSFMFSLALALAGGTKFAAVSWPEVEVVGSRKARTDHRPNDRKMVPAVMRKRGVEGNEQLERSLGGKRSRPETLAHRRMALIVDALCRVSAHWQLLT